MKFINTLRFSLLVLTLVAQGVFAQVSNNIAGSPESGDRLGEAVAAGDFNCDGFDDLAAGVPNEDNGGVTNVGVINIVYGGTGIGSQLGVLGNSYITATGGFQSNLQFGGVLAVGDFDGDGCDDLAVGIPYKDIGSDVDAGEVQVFYGHSNGPRVPAEIWNQDTAGIHGGAENNDHFGGSLAAGDYNGDGYDDLAIGVPGESNGVGYVYMLPGYALVGLTTAVAKFFNQDSTGIADTRESGDWFGSALASGDFNGDGYDDLAVGAPRENHLNKIGAGVAHVLYGSANFLSGAGSQIWHQDSAVIDDNERFGASLAAGDFNNDGRDDLAIGVPDDSPTHNGCSYPCPSDSHKGAVHVLYGTAAGVSLQGQQFFQLATNTNTHYGSALAAADYNGDGRDDLAVGGPKHEGDAGLVHILYGASLALTPTGAQFIHQDLANVEGIVEYWDLFGDALAAGDFDNDGRADLAVGIPRQRVLGIETAGTVQVFYGAAGALNPANDQIFTQ